MARAALKKQQAPEQVDPLQKLDDEAHAMRSRYDALVKEVGPLSDFPEALQLRARRFEQQLSQLEGRLYAAVADLVPLAQERWNYRVVRKNVVKKANQERAEDAATRIRQVGQLHKSLAHANPQMTAGEIRDEIINRTAFSERTIDSYLAKARKLKLIPEEHPVRAKPRRASKKKTPR